MSIQVNSNLSIGGMAFQGKSRLSKKVAHSWREVKRGEYVWKKEKKKWCGYRILEKWWKVILLPMVSYFIFSFSLEHVSPTREEGKKGGGETSPGMVTDTTKPTINFSLTEFLRSTQFSDTDILPLSLSCSISSFWASSPFAFYPQNTFPRNAFFIQLISSFFLVLSSLFHPQTMSNPPQGKVRSRSVFPSTP